MVIPQIVDKILPRVHVSHQPQVPELESAGKQGHQAMQSLVVTVSLKCQPCQ